MPKKQSAWQEMEQYEQGTIDNAAAVSVACWFGQLAFGVLGGVITGFFGHLVSSLSSEVSIFSVVDACISLGSSFGVFASSSGGGNPCLFVSGGGPYGFLLILTGSTASVLVSKHLLTFSSTLTSTGDVNLIATSSFAAGISTIFAGFAAAAAVKVVEEIDRRESDPSDDVEKANTANTTNTNNPNPKNYPLNSLQCNTTFNLKSGRNYDKLAQKIVPQRIRELCFEAVQEELGNPGVLMRIASVFSISLGLHFAFQDWASEDE
ncbi:hypothetical protein TrST_g2034 [Triparma strigata]|uniref:Uncharacterized protein n=1 Tax=Triparma strigata TaxID=1606541 RepID=A0A9W7EPM3_9STRA|nr:hypothetical protein TrST_g2034 [Triparma strigata]